MATAFTLTLVPVDEYLNTSYRPDMEYVDGVLVERGMPTYYHSILQIILARYFAPFEKDFQIKTLSELRTQIIEGARYRIPDILLCRVPTKTRKIFTEVPLVVIEILSPDDKLKDVMARFHDYESVGVQHIVQMDPEECVAHRYEHGSLMNTRLTGFLISRGDDNKELLPFNSEEIFAKLRQEIEDAAAEPKL